MINLTRRVHQVIKIGDKITVSILEIKGRQIKLGFDAPRDINIVRQELLGKTKSDKPVSQENADFVS